MVRAVSGQATMYLPQSPLTLKWSNTITKSFQWQRSPSTRPDWCGLDIFPEGDTALLWNIWLNSFLFKILYVHLFIHINVILLLLSVTHSLEQIQSTFLVKSASGLWLRTSPTNRNVSHNKFKLFHRVYQNDRQLEWLWPWLCMPNESHLSSGSQTCYIKGRAPFLLLDIPKLNIPIVH